MVQTKCGFNDSPDGKGAKGSELLVMYGPTLLVNIGFDPNYDAAAAPLKQPSAGISDVNALVDTGATESCIDNLLAAQLKLPIVDRRSIAGISGFHVANVYLAQVNVPFLKF